MDECSNVSLFPSPLLIFRLTYTVFGGTGWDHRSVSTGRLVARPPVYLSVCLSRYRFSPSSWSAVGFLFLSVFRLADSFSP